MRSKQEEILEAFLKLKEGSLKEFKRKFGSILGPDEVTPEMEREVKEELDAAYERVKLQPIGDDIDDEPWAKEDIEVLEGMTGNSKRARKEIEKIRESIGKPGSIRESRIYEPARIVKASSGDSNITEEGGDDLVEIMPQVSIPRALNEEANAGKVRDWLIENGYGEVPLESLTEIGFA